MSIPKDMVGRIIGLKGSNIMKLRETTGQCMSLLLSPYLLLLCSLLLVQLLLCSLLLLQLLLCSLLLLLLVLFLL